MEAVFFVQGHLTTDALEEYAFQRLSGAEIDTLEEHLLACPECQSTLGEVDEYILLMKHATSVLRAPVGARRWGNAGQGRETGLGSGRTGGIGLGRVGGGVGTLILAAVAFVSLLRRPVPAPEEAVKIPLIALRGGSPAMNHARAGRPLELAIDTSGLALGGPAEERLMTQGGMTTAQPYGIKVVDGDGKPVWSETIAAAQGPLPARIVGGLNAGVFWVRLYAGGKLVREFGLLVD